MSNVNCKAHNKAVQTDNSRAVCLVVKLSDSDTTRQTARELRLTAALCENKEWRAKTAAQAKVNVT